MQMDHVVYEVGVIMRHRPGAPDAAPAAAHEEDE